MKRKLLFVFTVIFCLCAVQAYAEEVGRVRLGVLQFLSRTDGVSADQAAAVGDIVARMLTNSKTINVIERTQLTQLAGEQAMSFSGGFTDDTAIRIGKIAGCQFMLIGAVTRYEHSYSTQDLFVFGSRSYSALATIDARIVNVETTEVILSLSETGTTSQKGTTFNFYGFNKQDKLDFQGLEAGAIADAATRLSFKIRDALTGEYSQILGTSAKDVTLSIGATGGAQRGSLFRVYIDGEEIRGVDGESLGRRMQTIAVVKITDVQRDFSIAEIAAKGAGNIKLIHRGDKIFPVTSSELSDMVKNKAFPKTRPREVKSSGTYEALFGR